MIIRNKQIVEERYSQMLAQATKFQEMKQILAKKQQTINTAHSQIKQLEQEINELKRQQAELSVKSVLHEVNPDLHQIDQTPEEIEQLIWEKERQIKIEKEKADVLKNTPDYELVDTEEVLQEKIQIERQFSEGLQELEQELYDKWHAFLDALDDYKERVKPINDFGHTVTNTVNKVRQTGKIYYDEENQKSYVKYHPIIAGGYKMDPNIERLINQQNYDIFKTHGVYERWEK